MRVTYLILVLLVMFLFCSKLNIVDNEDSIVVKPSVNFLSNNQPISPKNVVEIVLTVMYKDVIVTDTFNFADQKGTLPNIPKNTPFDLKIEALDANKILVYAGTLTIRYGASSDTSVVFNATLVSPYKPTNLKVEPFLNTSSIMELKWKDNSSNEDGFKIMRKIGESAFVEKCKLQKDITNYKDTINNSKKDSLVYRVIAFNSAGSSPFARKTFDPLEIFENPTKPPKPTTPGPFFTDVNYIFKANPVNCRRGHRAQYQFSWGKTTGIPKISEWLSDYEFNDVIWPEEGAKEVKCRVRCMLVHSNTTEWSEPCNVTVKKP